MHLQHTTAAVSLLECTAAGGSWACRSRHTMIRRPAAPRAHCQSGLQPSRSPLALRLVIQLAHVAVAVHHRTPASVQSPCLPCRARDAREAVVAAQEVLIEEGGIVPSNTKSPCRAGRAASPSTACGSLVDWPTSFPSLSMPPPHSAALALLAMTGTTNCSAPAETSPESIEMGCFRARERLGAVVRSEGRARRLAAARRAARDTGFVRWAPRGGLHRD